MRVRGGLVVIVHVRIYGRLVIVVCMHGWLVVAVRVRGRGQLLVVVRVNVHGRLVVVCVFPFGGGRWSFWVAVLFVVYSPCSWAFVFVGGHITHRDNGIMFEHPCEITCE